MTRPTRKELLAALAPFAAFPFDKFIDCANAASPKKPPHRRSIGVFWSDARRGAILERELTVEHFAAARRVVKAARR